MSLNNNNNTHSLPPGGVTPRWTRNLSMLLSLLIRRWNTYSQGNGRLGGRNQQPVRPGRHNTRRPRPPGDWSPRNVGLRLQGAGLGKCSQCCGSSHRCCRWVSVMPSINNNRVETAPARRGRTTGGNPHHHFSLFMSQSAGMHRTV